VLARPPGTRGVPGFDRVRDREPFSCVTILKVLPMQ
jgi:hypothetical protein